MYFSLDSFSSDELSSILNIVKAHVPSMTKHDLLMALACYQPGDIPQRRARRKRASTLTVAKRKGKKAVKPAKTKETFVSQRPTYSLAQAKQSAKLRSVQKYAAQKECRNYANVEQEILKQLKIRDMRLKAYMCGLAGK